MSSCPFCDYAGPVVADHGPVFVIEPLAPVVAGHLLAIPKRHVIDALEAPSLTGEAAMVAAQHARIAGYRSCNLIMSVGAAATQTVRHLHVHIVPRVEGDGLALPWTERSP